MKHPVIPYLVLAGISCLLFIPFLGSLHLLDWDEINFAEAAREMVMSGNYARVQINYEPFWEKPPLFFWMQSLFMHLFGINELAARFPNVISGFLTLSLIYYIGRRHFSASLANWWVLCYLGAFLPHLYFQTGLIDPWFNLFICSGIYLLARLSLWPGSIRYGYLWAGIIIGLGILTKGPVALLICGLTWVIFWISKRFHWYFNLKELGQFFLGVLLMVSLWFGPETLLNGTWFIEAFIRYQIELFSQPVATHGQPWFYHPLVLLLGCFPVSIFAIAGFYQKAAVEEQSIIKRWLVILFWVVLVLFSIVKTKIINYSSCCYLPLTFLGAWFLNQHIEGQSLKAWMRWSLLVLGALIFSSLLLFPLIALQPQLLAPFIQDPFARLSLDIPNPWQGWEWLPAAAFLPLAGYALFRIWSGEVKFGSRLLLLGTTLVITLCSWTWLPKIEAYSQGPAIEFFKRAAAENCYVASLNYKSYAPYFYGEVKQDWRPESRDIKWLIEGPVDKDVYFVAKRPDLLKVRSWQPELQFIEAKGGFVLLKRKAVVRP